MPSELNSFMNQTSVFVSYIKNKNKTKCIWGQDSQRKDANRRLTQLEKDTQHNWSPFWRALKSLRKSIKRELEKLTEKLIRAYLLI